MADLLDELQQQREAILRMARRYGAEDVRVFGSVAARTAREDSDIDLLVKFAPECRLIDQVLLKQELEQLLGCRVDVVSKNSIYWLL